MSTDQSLHSLGPDDEDKARFAQGLRFSFAGLAPDAARQARWLDLYRSRLLPGQTTAAASIGSRIMTTRCRRRALEHARNIADSMAKGLGAKLGALVYANNQTPPRRIFANSGFGNVELNTEANAAFLARQKPAPLVIQPQRITRSATVYAVFAIAE